MSDFETRARDERIAELKAEIAQLRSDLHVARSFAVNPPISES